MNYTLSNVITFAVGAAIGSAVTYKLIKKKYESIAEQEIAEMREYYREKKLASQQSEPVVEEKTDEEMDEYKAIVDERGYATGSLKKEVSDMDEPRVISPDEFGELEYDTVSLTYYEDGVLADDMDESISDIEDLIGNDALNHFGDNEDDPDAVYVRNDRMKIDYEILRDPRPYSEVCKLYRSRRVEG